MRATFAVLCAVVVLMGVAAADAKPQRTIRVATEAQRRLIVSTAPEVAISGGWYSAKTYGACVLAWAYCEQHPGAWVALCREERASMTVSTLKRLFEVLPPQFQTWHTRGRWGWKQDVSTLFFPPVDGKQSLIYCVGLDRPDRLLSSDFAIVIVDQAEQLTLEQFEMANGRSARQPGMPDGRTVLLFNPDDPEHWANRRYQFDLGSRVLHDADGKVTAEVINCAPGDNLDRAPERYRDKMQRLTGVWRERYYLNRWSRFEGMVFQAWDPDIHIVNAPEAWRAWGGLPPPDWERGRTLDFGYVDPFVCSWYAREPGLERWYRYREIYLTGRANEDHATDILRLEAQERETLTGLCGADASFSALLPQAQALSVAWSFSDHARQERETFARAGVWTHPADKDILAGIQTLITLLDPTQPGGPRLLYVRDALVEQDARLAREGKPTCTERELGSIRWRRVPESDAQRGLTRELPVDRDNHGFDACRYLFHSMASAPRVGVWG